MAEDNDTERTEDPTQKRLDDAHAKGDVAKSQEVNTWFVIAGATLVLSTFSDSVGAGILNPMRNWKPRLNFAALGAAVPYGATGLREAVSGKGPWLQVRLPTGFVWREVTLPLAKLPADPKDQEGKESRP